MRIRHCLLLLAVLLLAPTLVMCGGDDQADAVSDVDAAAGSSKSSLYGATGALPSITDKKLVRPVTVIPQRVQAPVGADDPTVRVIRQVDTLDDALAARPDGLLVPTHMENGFALQSIRADNASHEVQLEYRRAPGDMSAGLSILLGEQVVPWGMPVQEGHSEEVDVQGATEAQFIRGAKTISSDGDVEWGTEIMVSLMFYRDDKLVMFLASPPSEWPKEKLIAIAGSMEYYVPGTGGSGP